MSSAATEPRERRYAAMRAVTWLAPLWMCLYLLGVGRGTRPHIDWLLFAPAVLLPAAIGTAFKIWYREQPVWRAAIESIVGTLLLILVTAEIRDQFSPAWLAAVYAVQGMAGLRMWDPIPLTRDMISLRCIRYLRGLMPDWSWFHGWGLLLLAGYEAVAVAVLITINWDRIRVIRVPVRWVRQWVETFEE